MEFWLRDKMSAHCHETCSRSSSRLFPKLRVFRFQTINYYTESNQLRSFFCLFLAYVCVCTPKLPNNIQIFWLTLVKGIIHVRYTRGIHRHTQEKTFTNNLVQQQTLSLEIFLTKSASAYASVCIFCGMRET